MKKDNKTPAPKERLEQLIASDKTMVFMQDNADKEYPKIKYDLFGAPETNELFVRVKAGDAVFVAVTKSPLLVPRMADRIWGPDVADWQAADELSSKLWEKHRGALLAAIGKTS